MIEFTKEEISLCKQIAEKHRKDISDGDWIYHEPHNNYFLVIHNVIFHYQLQTEKWFDEQNAEHRKINTPLWQIHDCILWLKERYDDVNFGSIQDEWEVQVHDAYDKVHHPESLEDLRGKTPLEACLKAVLAVLEEIRNGK